LQGKYGTGRVTKITLKTSYGNISLRKTSGESMQAPAAPHVPKPPHGASAPEIPEPEEN
jgi:hypothetical protein